MLLQALIFLAGLVILYFGAEWLIRGAASLALSYGIRPIVVGVTVVALGTSMPEFVINFFAAFSGQDRLALGNIIGSNICNLSLIVGTSAIILPLAVAPGTLKKEYPIMMSVMVLFFVVALDGTISKVDGLLLLGGLAAFLVYVVFDARRHAARTGTKDASDRPRGRFGRDKAFYLIAGVVLLAAGARMMVYAAVNMAATLGIDPVVVGLTIVAVGTSLPELAASVVGALKRESDISIGNILGSNLLNVLFVVGLVATIQPLEVDAEALTIHFPVMLAFGLLFLPVAWTDDRITRFEGWVLLAVFSSYMIYLSYPYL
jgi:cation:H+ antiporter